MVILIKKNIIMYKYFYSFILALVIVIGCNNRNPSIKESNIKSEEVVKSNNSFQIIEKKKTEYNEYIGLIELSDTIYIGKNVGKIVNYKPRRSDIDYLLSVIIENEYDNGRIVKDTFSDGTLAPWFGVYANKIGFKKIRGTILEEALNDDKSKFDSVLRIERTFIHFVKEVYVMDSIFRVE